MQSGRLKMLLDEKEDWPNAVKTALWPITSLVELGMRKNWQEDSQLAEALKQGGRRILDLFGAMEREWVETESALAHRDRVLGDTAGFKVLVENGQIVDVGVVETDLHSDHAHGGPAAVTTLHSRFRGV